MKALTLGLAALLLLGIPRALPAQDAPCSTRTVMVSVVDRGGSPVSGLTAANFRAKIGGQAIEILYAEADITPRRIVLVIDISGSIEMNLGKRKALTTLANDFCDFAPQHGAMAQVIFSSGVLLKQHFDDSRPPRELLTRAWERTEALPLTVSTKTALYDAIREALAELHSPRHGDVIYVISDAADNSSKTSLRELQDILEAAKVRLFASIVGTTFQWPSGELAGPGKLIDVVKATGGNFVHLISDDPFRDYWNSEKKRESDRLAVTRMSQEMCGGYNLNIRLPSAVTKSQSWNLRVLTENGAPRRDIHVHYPQKLMPCTSDGQQN